MCGDITVNLKENIRRATIEIIILKLLSEDEKYVYALIQEIEELSDGAYTIPEATIYPVMYRLVKKGYVSEDVRIIDKRMRRYYKITPQGKECYYNSIAEYKEIMSGLHKILDGGEKE